MTVILRMLKRSPLFAALDDTLLGEVANLGRRRSFAAEETVFLRGAPGDGLCGIVSGRVKVVTESPDGQERLLNLLLPGEVFGEIALLDGGPRTATAVALEATELVTIERRVFVALLERHPALAVRMLTLVCRRLRWMHELMEDAAFLPGPQRLAKRLLGLHRAGQAMGGPDGAIRISQQELARFAGLSRQSVNQQLRQWESAGHVTLGRGVIRVEDAPALDRFSMVDGAEAPD